jgi:hypothetical protein
MITKDLVPFSGINSFMIMKLLYVFDCLRERRGWSDKR